MRCINLYGNAAILKIEYQEIVNPTKRNYLTCAPFVRTLRSMVEKHLVIQYNTAYSVMRAVLIMARQYRVDGPNGMGFFVGKLLRDGSFDTVQILLRMARLERSNQPYLQLSLWTSLLALTRPWKYRLEPARSELADAIRDSTVAECGAEEAKLLLS